MTARGARPTARCSRRLWLSPASWKVLERFLRLPKQDMETLSSAASPIFSSVEADEWIGESPGKRDGELERNCSFADNDHEGRMQFSFTAKGLVTEDRDDKLWRWTLLTKGRVEKPPSSSLLSPVISTDSDSEASEVRLDEAAEVTLACLLPGSRLTQCSHREELVEPATELLADQDGMAVRLW